MMEKVFRKRTEESLFEGWVQRDPGFSVSPSTPEAYEFAYKKLGVKPRVEVDSRLDRGFEELYWRLWKFVPEHNVVLSTEECVSRLNLSASAGVPYQGTKRGLMITDPTTASDALAWLNAELDDGKFEILPFRAVPKVEQLKAKKIVTCDERIVNVAPFKLAVCTNAYLGKLFDYLMLNHESHPIKVGMSTYYGGLRRLWGAHKKHKHHFSFDVSGLEHSFTSSVHAALGKLQGKLAHTNKRLQDLVSLIHEHHSHWLAVHMNGHAVEVEQIEPSGSGSTIWDNSMFVLAVIYAFLLDKGYDIDDFEISVLGDDVFISTSLDLDNRAFALAFQEFGLLCNVFFKIEGISPRMEDHAFLGNTIDKNGRIVTDRVGKMFNKLLTAGLLPMDNYEIAVGIRDCMFQMKEFDLVDRFCAHLETTFGLENRRTPPLVLEMMYA